MCFGEKNYDFKHHRYLPFPWTIGNSQGVWDEFIEPNHHIYVMEAASSQYIFTKQYVAFPWVFPGG